MYIKIDDLSGPQIFSFLQDHLQHMRDVTPQGCVHALDIDALKKPEVTFWTVWEQQELICCGALKALNKKNAELKSMRTAPAHTGKGVASYLLEYILKESRYRGYENIFLETGSSKPFEPARKLYEKYGFEYCDPFADYSANHSSVFMKKAIH